ncbi:MAG: VacJ family lipoprotein [Pseudomonadota bacterium]
MIRSPLALLVMLSLGLTGCATTSENNDPWEGYNRGMTSFNNGADRVLLKPLARGYRAVTPDLMERGVSNFFSNLGEPVNILNNLLQGKPVAALSDTGRLLLNSTMGIGGLFDVASKSGMPRHNEDFGQTMAKWGVPSGPYFVLPFLGPSTVRDAFGAPADRAVNLIEHLDSASLEDKLTVLQIISIRASLLPLDAQINASNDPYLFVREAYLQRRNFLVYDGEPPIDEEDFEFDEDFDEDLDNFDDDL